ncbi:beta-ketoacyl-ACP synthase III [Rapidithrix thailandica]|uniref:Beta-ketoacyl-[acyl-carrier-protein] synthase III n=1 Tax=Rapidithrix thailandica TaxID=413964 RepID=A0AAW9S1Y2_9BACT
MTKMRAAITGVAGYVPSYVLTNDELATMVDTNDEWITERTGIKERRILKGEEKGTSILGIEATKRLLEKTNTSPEEVDLLICCTVTGDMPFPATANIISAEVGIKNAFSYDLNAACSGFLYGLVTGAQFVQSGTYKKVIVVGADKMSSIVDYQDRTTCILFGDGAGAVMLEPTEGENGIMDFYLRSDGAGEPYLNMPAGGSRKPASHQTVENREHYAKQDGRTVFKFAVTHMAEAAAKVMEENKLTGDDIAFLVPHQANKRIIDATARRMDIGDEKVMLNIQRYGNTTSGTIPLCLVDYENQLKKGDNLILAAFGGGFTWGAVYVKWAIGDEK